MSKLTDEQMISLYSIAKNLQERYYQEEFYRKEAQQNRDALNKFYANKKTQALENNSKAINDLIGKVNDLSNEIKRSWEIIERQDDLIDEIIESVNELRDSSASNIKDIKKIRERLKFLKAKV